jgi:hypothetical protein
VQYTFPQPDRSNSAPSDSQPNASGTTEIDFSRHIARTRVTTGKTSFESIATDTWTYVRVPPERRARSSGKEWVRYPTERGATSLLDPKMFIDPIGSAQKGVGVVPQGVRPTRVGDEIIDGAVLPYETATDTGTTCDFWLDERGWLARATASFDDATETSAGEFVYNTPVTTEEPATDDAFEVANEEAAQAIAGSSSTHRRRSRAVRREREGPDHGLGFQIIGRVAPCQKPEVHPRVHLATGSRDVGTRVAP